ncbi:DUF4838 domain-containing protein [Dysgonomonas reticulitermitis]
MKSYIYILLTCICPLFCNGQINIVKNGIPKSRIIVDKQDSTDLKAAFLLQDFTKRISGATIEVLGKESRFKPGDILIGSFQLPVSGVDLNRIEEDGFYLSTNDPYIRIISNDGKGSIYGVVSLLEDYFGVHYYAKDIYTLNERKNIVVPAGLNRIDNPAFRHRQTTSYGNEDPVYKVWFRLEDPKEMFASNLWVHSFNRILPSAVYGKTHPEYYSFINGKRQPGEHSQWCLTNPELFEVVAGKIDSIFKVNPGSKMVSISQNDGNDTYCTCPQCKAVDEYEGSPSGSLIRFMNKLAERFPDKEFSTLAYLYSVQPPKHVKPLPNVNIMLCDIDCKREVPITDNESGHDFMKALVGWGKISNNIFVWDYGINFDNMVSPFPNFHILQKNIQEFKKNNATMIYEQVNGVKGTDFSEMRAYMLAKLMWNPELDTDSLMLSFMNGYYGKAAPFLYQYQKIMEGALLGSHIPLWIYDSPISHKNGMLSPYLLKTYNELFDKAENAVRDDEALLKRVRLSRLPLQYSELEIARTLPDSNRDDLIAKVALFKERTSEYDVRALTERGNPPSEYCDIYLKRFLPGETKNIAKGAKITWIIPPAEKYKTLGESALTDGLFGGTTYVESWVGWEGTDAGFIIDLGEEKSFRSVETDVLHQLGAWILLPAKISYSTSSDNNTFTDMGSFEFHEDRDLAVKFFEGKVVSNQPVHARYIKVFIKGIGDCPPWHYGIGHPAWFFIDEVVVH